MANVVTETFLAGPRTFAGEKFTNAFARINKAFGTSTGGPATTATWPIGSTADGLTATPSGNQSTALLLTAQINRISTVGSAADAVRLIPATPGIWQVVINDAASNSMQVYGSGTDTINDVATATGVAQAAGKTATYYCSVAGKWYRNLSA